MKFSTLISVFCAVNGSEESERDDNKVLTLKEIILKPTGKRNAIGLERFGINMGKKCQFCRFSFPSFLFTEMG